jgi:predicted MFS family arabinose efflux permease
MHTTAAEPARTAAPSTFGALRHANYRLFWTAQFLAVTGQTMEFVALGWLVYQLTGSAFSLGVTGLAQALPRIALVMVGGAVADRVDRRILLMSVQLIVAAMYATLATLVVLEIIQVWHVWLMALVFGALRAFDNPSRQAILPLLVTREEIPSAVALGNLAWEMPRLIGPATAGVLISLIGLGSTFYVASLGFILSLLMYSMMRIQRAEARPRGNLLHDMAGGLIFVRHNEIFAAFIGLVFFNSAFGMSYQLLMPVFARDILQVGSEGFGFMQALLGAGAVVGSLMAARLAPSGRRGAKALIGAALFGGLIIVFAWSASFPFSMALLFLMGGTHAYYMITISTTLQVLVPNEYRGRVMGLWSLTWSLVPLSGTIGGSIAEVAGVAVAVSAGGGVVIAMAALMAVLLPQVRRLD